VSPKRWDIVFLRVDEKDSVGHPAGVLSSDDVMGDTRQQRFNVVVGTKKQLTGQAWHHHVVLDDAEGLELQRASLAPGHARTVYLIACRRVVSDACDSALFVGPPAGLSRNIARMPECSQLSLRSLLKPCHAVPLSESRFLGTVRKAEHRAVLPMTTTVAMIVVGLLLGGRGLSLSALWLPLIVIPIVALALGMSWVLAALGVFFRDIGQIVGAATTALMFASAIFYPASRVAGKAPSAWPFIRWNPLIHAIEAARDVLIWDRSFSSFKLGMLYLAGGSAALFGFACFVRSKRAFADVM
jgi:hypothetical protein